MKLLLIFFLSLAVCRLSWGEVKDLPPEGLVEKEYLAIRASSDPAKMIAPYRERRQRWGFLFSLGYATYTPENYQPNFQPDFDFNGLYDSNGMLELNITRKLNFSVGSIGLGVGVGYAKATSGAGAPANSELTVIPLKAEVSLILDALFREPWVAPYGFGGVYTAYFKEKQAADTASVAGSSFNGTTAAATYIGAGLNIQLNWLEPRTALRSYLDYGIENTFIYVEIKKYLTSFSENDPDFETGLIVAGGAKFEY